MFARALKWLDEKKGEIFFQSVFAPLVTWILAWLASRFVEHGMIRDIGFYVICVATILAGCFFVVWRDRKKATGIIKTAFPFLSSVIIYRAEAQPNFYPTFPTDGIEPSLVFHFWIFNGSSTTLRIKDISGHVKFNGVPIAGNLDVALGSKQEDMPASGKHKVTLRQWISVEKAKLIHHVTADKSSKSEFAFDTARLLIVSREAGVEKEEGVLELPLLSAKTQQWEIRWP